MLVSAAVCLLGFAVSSDTLVLVGFGVVAAAFFGFIFWTWWKKFTPRGFAYWMGAMLCMGLIFVSAIRATVPSSAPRRQVVGRLVWISKHGQGRGAYYNLGVVVPNGNVVALRAAPTPPFFAKNEWVSITYLDEKVYTTYRRAIAIRVLSGPRAGWQDEVSADWLGPWLGIPLGIAGGLVLMVLAAGNERPRPKLVPTAEGVETLGITR